MSTLHQQQPTATSIISSMPIMSSAATATAVAPLGGGGGGGMKNSVTALVLPSPTGSASETSDYQRSTPSPRDEPDSGIGSVEDWSSGASDASSTNNGGSLHPVRSASRPSEDSTNDQGFSEDLKEPLVPTTKEKRLSTNSNPEKSSVDPRLTLQQVRVALQKIPLEECSQIIGRKDIKHLQGGVKRRSSDSACLSESAIKKAKISDLKTCCKVPSEQAFPPSTTQYQQHKNGKITSYMSETKPFSALRKEKLDRILNLNPYKKTESSDSSSQEESASKKQLESPSVFLDPAHHQNKNDLFLISQLKQLKDAASKATENEDGKSKNCLCPSDQEIKDEKKPFDKFSEPQELSATQIRFPVIKPPSESILCKWDGCEEVLDSPGKLIDHMLASHVDTQNPDNDEDYLYKCLWKGCKVYGKGSSSKSWLEKHITNHGGNKPFQCIVDGCKLRFSTQSLLERHVNSHFKKKQVGPKTAETSNEASNGATQRQISNSSTASGGSTSGLTSIVKVMRKAGRKLKVRKTIYSARIFDLFDIGTMAQVQEQLFNIHSAYSKELNISNDEVHLKGVIGGKRAVMRGKKEEVMVLQQWRPENILPDEWVPVNEFQSSKVLPINALTPRAKAVVADRILPRGRPTGKRPRKAKTPQVKADTLS